MKRAILSDIHGNWEALSNLLPDLPEEVICLGDVIGYGPDPGRCLDVIREKAWPCLLGNHEAVQLEPDRLDNFTKLAQASYYFTKDQLRDRDLAFLQSLPYELVEDQALFCHAAPYHPEHFHYLLAEAALSAYCHLSFARLDELGIRLAFHGHTHRPGYFKRYRGKISYHLLRPDQPVSLRADASYLINCGSVGQPRNRDPKSHYLLWQDDHLELKNKAYDLWTTQRKITASPLPDDLGKRLLYGQ